MRTATSLRAISAEELALAFLTIQLELAREIATNPNNVTDGEMEEAGILPVTLSGVAADVWRILNIPISDTPSPYGRPRTHQVDDTLSAIGFQSG